MRNLRHGHSLLAFTVLVAAAASAGTPTASAQSFFEQLFGLNRPQPSAAPQRQALAAQPSFAQGTERIRSERPARERGHATNEGSTIQTVCVRACDGYYWPLHYPATKRDFSRDEAQCQAECGSQTRLYTRTGPGEDAEAMRDLDGKSYGASDTAFAYRKGLVNGCACRPMPWSESERARHERYALIEAETALRLAHAQAALDAAAADASAARTAPGPDAVIASAAPAVSGPPVGPNEAALSAATIQTQHEIDTAAATPLPGARTKARRPALARLAESVVPKPAARPRRTGRDERTLPIRMAAGAASKPGLFGSQAKFTYPGDR